MVEKPITSDPPIEADWPGKWPLSHMRIKVSTRKWCCGTFRPQSVETGRLAAILARYRLNWWTASTNWWCSAGMASALHSSKKAFDVGDLGRRIGHSAWQLV
jgi:hypothetical protein